PGVRGRRRRLRHRRLHAVEAAGPRIAVVRPGQPRRGMRRPFRRHAAMRVRGVSGRLHHGGARLVGSGGAGSGPRPGGSRARMIACCPPGTRAGRACMMGPMNAKPKPAAHSRASRRPSFWARAAWLLVGAALSLPAAAQPRVGQGSLLVSTDEIGDKSWSRTVVLVLHHGSNGTLGIAINRPTEVAPQEIVPDLGEVPGFDGRVFRGGPVQPTQLVFLVRDPPAGL